MTHLLLSTVFGPFGNSNAGEGKSVGAELFHKQITRAQGVFSIRQMIRGWGLDYIAANLKTPSTVLHYPTVKMFRQELREHHYTHIGIHFVVATLHRMQEMVKIIRQESPHSKIILGGYGTVLPDELLSPLGDYICREEGIVYMRRLLGENENEPIRHPYAPVKSPRIISMTQPEVVGHITGGLGCPNGCDFCSTSHFFACQYHPFITNGREMYAQLVNQYETARKLGKEMVHVSLIDEDFFVNETRAREYLQTLRENPVNMSIMGFGSIRSLSKYTGQEIAEMGFDILWIGLEGEHAHFDKLNGRDPAELFRDLRDHGICILASSIIGLPYQTPDIIQKEFLRGLSLNPCFSQYLIYFGFPGTPLYRRAEAEHLFRPEYATTKDWKKWDGFAQHFIYDAFKDGELEKIQEELYNEETRRLGASIFRVCETWLDAIPKLEASDSLLLHMRAKRLRGMVAKIRPILPMGTWMAPSLEVKKKIKGISQKFNDIIGPWPLIDRCRAVGAPIMGAWTYFAERLGLDNMAKPIRVESHEL